MIDTAVIRDQLSHACGVEGLTWPCPHPVRDPREVIKELVDEVDLFWKTLDDMIETIGNVMLKVGYRSRQGRLCLASILVLDALRDIVDGKDPDMRMPVVRP